MNEKISLNFGNPLEKNPIPKDTFASKKELFNNKSMSFNKNKALDKKFNFDKSFNFNNIGINNPILNKKLNTNLKNSSIEPKLDYKKIGGEAFKRINQQKGLPMFGDYDGDGVKNILDCWPLDPKRQGSVHTIEDIYRNPNLTEEEKQSAILSLQAQQEALAESQSQPVQPTQNNNKENALRKLGSLLSSSASSLYSATGIPDKLEEQREQKEFQRQAKLAALESIRADISKGKDSVYAKEIARQELQKLFPQPKQPIGSRIGNALDATAYGAQSSIRGLSQGVRMSGLGGQGYQGETFKNLGTINPLGVAQQQMQPVPQQQMQGPPQQYQSSGQPPQGQDLKSQISNAKKPFWGPVAPDGRKWSERSKKYVTYERGNYQDYTRPTYNTQYGGGQ